MIPFVPTHKRGRVPTRVTAVAHASRDTVQPGEQPLLTEKIIVDCRGYGATIELPEPMPVFLGRKNTIMVSITQAPVRPKAVSLQYRIAPYMGNPGPKVIEWGWGTPSPVQAKAMIKKMQDSPFDGLVFSLYANGLHDPSQGAARAKCFAWRNWGKQRLDAEEFRESIDALATTNFGRFTDNFLRFNVTPGRVDWFSKDFEAVLLNARLLARVARDAAMKGILFDVEIYNGAPWHYPSQVSARKGKGKTFAEYQRQVRQRGRQFIQTINAEYPDITIILTFGYYVAMRHVRSPGDSLEQQRYGLLPSFLDGMSDAASPGTVIYDGWEFSYGYRAAKPFQEAREIIRKKGQAWTSVPKAYQEHYRASFGLWLDHGGKIWDTKDFTKNYFTPDEFAYALHQAMRYSDRYVWIYSHHVRPWERALPRAYRNAFEKARNARVEPPAPRARNDPAGRAGPKMLNARTYKGADDKSTFGDLWNNYRELMSLPETGWKFHIDPKDMGVDNKWYAVDFDDSAWKTIEIRQWWEPQGYRYDGVAWYRRKVTFPPQIRSLKGRKVFLAFGAVDESAWIYLNGQLVGKHDLGELGWNKHFLVDVTGRIHPGEADLLVVRVYDRSAYGGIWKAVKVVIER